MWDKGKLHKAKGQKACPEYPQLLLDPYFKINSWIYMGILGVLVKKITSKEKTKTKNHKRKQKRKNEKRRATKLAQEIKKKK